MPRFYFDTDDGQTSTRDDYGIQLADRNAACHAAVDTLPDLARGALPAGDERRKLAVNVRDAAGRTILTATLSLAVEWT